MINSLPRQASHGRLRLHGEFLNVKGHISFFIVVNEKVQVGKDQEKAQSEKDSHSKNRGGKKPN